MGEVEHHSRLLMVQPTSFLNQGSLTGDSIPQRPAVIAPERSSFVPNVPFCATSYS